MPCCLQVFECVFAAVFTAEMLIKWLSIGLLGKGAYFRSGWNVLDFALVIFGWARAHAAAPTCPCVTRRSRRRPPLSYAFLLKYDFKISVLRVLRVLRPLRTINKFRGLRVLVRTMLRSLSALRDVAVLVVFLLFVYAVIAVQLWAGSGAFRAIAVRPCPRRVLRPAPCRCTAPPLLPSRGGGQCGVRSRLLLGRHRRPPLRSGRSGERGGLSRPLPLCGPEPRASALCPLRTRGRDC